MHLTPYVERVIATHPDWKSARRINSEAVELYVEDKIRCPECGSMLRKLPANTPSKDFDCTKCCKAIQVKFKRSDIIKDLSKENNKISGAAYKPTMLNINKDIDWYIVYLKSNVICGLVRIKSMFINEANIIPRRPLSNTARRAGWQGCYLSILSSCMIKLDLS